MTIRSDGERVWVLRAIFLELRAVGAYRLLQIAASQRLPDFPATFPSQVKGACDEETVCKFMAARRQRYRLGRAHGTASDRPGSHHTQEANGIGPCECSERHHQAIGHRRSEDQGKS